MPIRNRHNLVKGTRILIDRGDDPNVYVVHVPGKDHHRVYQEGGDAETASFLILDTEVREVLSRPQPKAPPALDRTGETVKRVCYIPGTGYVAHLRKGHAANTRIAPIVGGVVQGAGDTVPSATLGAVYDLDFQYPHARSAVLNDPAGAPAPAELGMRADA